MRTTTDSDRPRGMARYMSPLNTKEASLELDTDPAPPPADVAEKYKAINTRIAEIDMLAAIAKMLDAAPKDVQERVAAWVAAKYGKAFGAPLFPEPFRVEPPAKPFPMPVPWPGRMEVVAYACPPPVNDPPMWTQRSAVSVGAGDLGIAVSSGFQVAEVGS